ncbi:MAG: DsrE family protein [Methanoregula sp.]|jgi:tRNA 2-thiouridine synthesizing protein C
MSSHFFLLGEAMTRERISWLEEVLKYFFIMYSPETLRHPIQQENPVVVFFITGDALYSLVSKETLPVWEIIISLPSVQIICDQDELDLRGISLEPLKMKHPDHVSSRVSSPDSTGNSFWGEILEMAVTRAAIPDTVGYLQIRSPYMYQASGNSLRCLKAALDRKCSPELYAFLDGVHIGHSNQRPADFRNLGEGFVGLCNQATRQGLNCSLYASSRSAIARGYGTWDDGQGTVISSCTIKNLKIRTLQEIIERFGRGHAILAETYFSLCTPHCEPDIARDLTDHSHPHPLPVIIFITKSPYGTELALGALFFALACAHHGIGTRVIFIEDGVYALSGDHKVNPLDQFFNIQEVIDSSAWSEKLQFCAFLPSLYERGIMKNKKLNAVMDIGSQELGKILFDPAQGIRGDYQRVFFF